MARNKKIKTDNAKEKRVKGRYRAQIKQAYKENKAPFWVYIVLRALVVGTGILQFFNGNYENVFMCVLTLILLFLPTFVERRLDVIIPDTLEIIILLFIFSAEILGEINSYYEKIPMWDTMLHTINGFIAAAVGFSMVDILNRNERILVDMSPFFMALVGFCFSMTIGVMWEFFEFFMDVTFLTDMQKDTVVSSISSVMLNPLPVNNTVIIKDITETAVNGQILPVDGYLDIGLYDTMKDLFVNFIGAVVFSVFGFFYARSEMAEAYCSRQPFFPQPQRSSSSYLTQTCPISPPAP